MLNFYLVSILKILGVISLFVVFLFFLFWLIQAIRYYLHYYKLKCLVSKVYCVEWRDIISKDRRNFVIASSVDEARKKIFEQYYVGSDPKFKIYVVENL